MQNVQGYERALSIGLGLASLACGLHRGGVSGIGLATLGGLGLLRGLSGHCVMKGYLRNPQYEMYYLKGELIRLREAVARLVPQHPVVEPVMGAETMVHGFDRSLLSGR